MNPPNWRTHAKCAEPGVDSELFFTREGDYELLAKQRINAAQAICAACPVSQICREEAERRREKHGVWGGKNFDKPPSAMRKGPREVRCERCGEIFEQQWGKLVSECARCLFEFKEPKVGPRRRRARLNSQARFGSMAAEMGPAQLATAGPLPDHLMRGDREHGR